MAGRCPHANFLSDLTSEQVLQKTTCDTCKYSGPHLWLCLHYDCQHVGCDENRSDHMMLHYQANNEHCLALNLSNYRVLCFECDSEVILGDQSSTYRRYRLGNATIANADRNSEDECYDDDRNLKPRGLTGLQNIGNSCYMNAAIQALSNCPPMTRFFLDCGGFVKSDKKPNLAKNYCKLMMDMWNKRRPSYVTPLNIAYGIKQVFPVFRGYNQQDSQEFLRCFMDQLHEEMKEPITIDRVSKFDNICSMDIDMSPASLDSTEESSFSDEEYETCESGLSSEKSSCSEKTGLMANKTAEDVISSSHGNSKSGSNCRGGMGGNGGNRHKSSISEASPASSPGYDAGGYELASDEFKLYSLETEGSDATSDQSVIGGSTALLLSRPSSSLSSIPDKTLPSADHLLKGLSVSSPQLKTQANHPANTNYNLYQSQNISQPVQKISMAQTKMGRRKKQVKYRSIISDVFDGKILSSVQCLTCNRISSTKETFQDLSLPIPSREYLNVLHASQTNFQKSTSLSTCTDVYSNQGWLSWMFGWMKSWFWGPTVSLQDCLAAFFSADELKGDNMYSCEQCKKLRNGRKYSNVLSLPEILCVHLKRFRHEVMFSSKITNYVSFPMEGLDMRPFMYKDCSTAVTKYDLVAVICHHGTAVGGHYITYALNCLNDQWYEFDDQCVTEVDPQTVAKCQAYVLFYRKTSEEMNKKRQRAVELLEICKVEASLMQFYISKQWGNTFNTFAEPGPINNSDFLCAHGGVQPSKFAMVDDLCTVLSQGVWEYLYDSFGGGLPCTRLYSCVICQNELKALENRRKLELEEFLNLRSDPQMKDTTTTGTCAISMSWFRTWESFVRGKENDPPAAIDNTVIATSKNGQAVLRMGSDYALVSTDVWLFLHSIYDGGPYLPLRQSLTTSDTITTPLPCSDTNASETNNVTYLPKHQSPTAICNVHSTTLEVTSESLEMEDVDIKGSLVNC